MKLVCIVLFSSGGVFEINLDRRKLKTPGGKLFTVPNEALAIAVATEWDAQKDTLKFYTMHLVSDSIKMLHSRAQLSCSLLVSSHVDHFVQHGS